MRVTVKHFKNAVAPVFVCEHEGMTRTLTMQEARELLDMYPEAAGTDTYDALAFAGLGPVKV